VAGLNGGTVRGVVGAVKWYPNGRIVPLGGAYFDAATVEGYAVQRTPANEWSVVGRVVLSDAYKLAQRPLMFVAPHKGGEFRWPILSFEIRDDRIVARLGPPAE
jgi:hypothetical protein